MSKRPMTARDLFALKIVNDPQVAPDGRRVVFTVTELDEAENCYRAALWLVDLSDGTQRKLTSGRARDGQPRWSPDGAAIAFTSNRNPDDAGKGQIWSLNVAGGEPTR